MPPVVKTYLDFFDKYKIFIEDQLNHFATLTGALQVIHNNIKNDNLRLYKEISKKGYKVAISGIGADEIFSGYYDHHLAYFYDIHKNKILFNKSLIKFFREKMKTSKKFFYTAVKIKVRNLPICSQNY